MMTSSFVDAVAGMYGIPVRETPVGFKYIAEVMEKENLIIGGEESGGLTIKGHVPEKDGILACLLMAELVAVERTSLRKILEKLYKKVGAYHTARLNFHLPAEKMNGLKERLSHTPPERIAGKKVKDLITIDGYKFIMEDRSWLGLRLSGTEPVVRLYLEAPSINRLKTLEEAGKKILGI